MNRPLVVMRGLGSFAEAVNPTPPPNADQISAEMDKMVSAARRAILLMKGKAAFVPAAVAVKPTWLDIALGPIGPLIQAARAYTAFSNETTSVDDALNTLGKLVDKLDGPDRADVLSGQLDPNGWVAAMQAVQQGIYSLGQGLDYNDPATILWNQIQDSKAAILKFLYKAGDAINHTLDWLKWAIPLTLAGGIGIALLLNPATHAAVSVARKGIDVGSRAANAAVNAAKSEINKSTAKPLAGLTRRQLRLRRRHQRRRRG